MSDSPAKPVMKCDPVSCKIKMIHKTWYSQFSEWCVLKNRKKKSNYFQNESPEVASFSFLTAYWINRECFPRRRVFYSFSKYFHSLLLLSKFHIYLSGHFKGRWHGGKDSLEAIYRTYRKAIRIIRIVHGNLGA